MPRKRPVKKVPSLRLEWRDPAELSGNPQNWRTHPSAQVSALSDVIAEVGWAGALLYNERTQRLIDGHARKELFAGKGKVPVLVGSWDEATERKILATLDPLGALAQTDEAALAKLLEDVQTGSAVVQAMLDGMKDSPRASTTEPTQPPQFFNILIECPDESSQVGLLERFAVEGLRCRSLIS